MFRLPPFLTPLFAVALLLVPLLAWRGLYATSALAPLPLLFLLVVLIAAGFGPVRARNLIWRRAVLAPDGWPARVLTGRLSALFRATVFALVAVSLLAWVVVQGEGVEQLLLLAVALAAVVLRVACRLPLAHWFQPNVARLGLNALAILVPAVIATPLLAWVHWEIIAHPAHYGQISALAAINHGLAALPQGAGFEAVVFSALQAADSLKLWLIAQFPALLLLAGGLYSLQAALLAWLVARAAVLVADLMIETNNHPVRG